MMALDAILINVIYIFSISLRFDMNPDPAYLGKYLEHFLVVTIIKIVIFSLCNMYRAIWEYASIREIGRASCRERV